MLEANTKLRYYKKCYEVHIPKCVGSDSAFPFDMGDDIQVKIEGRVVIMYKKN